MPDLIQSILFAITQLANPEYRHLALHPLLVHGILLSSIFLTFTFILRQRKASAVALLLLIICSLCIFPYADAREASVDTLIASQSEYHTTDITAYQEAVVAMRWYFTGLAGLALIALLTGAGGKAVSITFLILTLIGGFALSAWSLSLHYRESQIYHPHLAEPIIPHTPEDPDDPEAPDDPEDPEDPDDPADSAPSARPIDDQPPPPSPINPEPTTDDSQESPQS